MGDWSRGFWLMANSVVKRSEATIFTRAILTAGPIAYRTGCFASPGTLGGAPLPASADVPGVIRTMFVAESIAFVSRSMRAPITLSGGTVVSREAFVLTALASAQTDGYVVANVAFPLS